MYMCTGKSPVITISIILYSTGIYIVNQTNLVIINTSI